MPSLPTPLIGRQVEMAMARDLLQGGARLLTVTGPPGVGKTSLALALGTDLAGRFTDGAWLVDLAPVTDAEVVAATIADALDLRGRGLPMGRLLGALRQRDLLLVLDNFEQVVAAAPVVAELLAACAGVRAIVTSRVPLRLRWEHEIPLQPLGLPNPAGPRTAAAIAGVPAVRLFVDRARAVNAGFALTDTNAGAVADICTRLDGLPLAIELAAARTRLLTPQQMHRQLMRSDGTSGPAAGLGLLADGPRDLPPRQQTLRDAIAWSYALLTEAEQTMLRRMAAFAGGATVEATELVCDAPWTELASLVEKSLLRQDTGSTLDAQGGREPRVRMLEMVREFALEQLEASGELEATRRRHLALYVGLAEEAEPRLYGPEQDAWMDRLGQERENLRTAAQWAAKIGDAESMVRLGAALARFWRARCDEAEARERVEHILALGPAVPLLPVAVRGLHGAGELASVIGEYDTAQALFERSRDVALQLGDRAGVATGLRALSKLAGQRGKYDEAVQLGDACLAVFEERHDLPALALTLREIGMFSLHVGDLGRARQRFERSLAIAGEVGDQRAIANAAFGLALTHHLTGEFDAAERLYMMCLAIDRAQGHRTSEGSVLNNLGHVATLRGEVQKARTLLLDSLVASRDGGDRRRLAFTLSAVAGLLAVEGDAACAVRLDAAGLAALDAIGAVLGPLMRSLYDDLIAPARRALGPDGVLAAEAVGRATSLDQAVDEALACLSAAVTDPAPAERVTAPPAQPGRQPAPRQVELAAEHRTREPAESGQVRLTRREREVAALIAQGCTNREIAEALVVTEGTAANHVQRLMNRLGLHNRAQIAAWAVRHRLHEQHPTTQPGP